MLRPSPNQLQLALCEVRMTRNVILAGRGAKTPEPVSLLLMGVGGAALLIGKYKKRAKESAPDQKESC
jgi:hypothetical protein